MKLSSSAKGSIRMVEIGPCYFVKILWNFGFGFYTKTKRYGVAVFPHNAVQDSIRFISEKP